MVERRRREVQAIDQDQPVFTVQTVAQMLTQQQLAVPCVRHALSRLRS